MTLQAKRSFENMQQEDLSTVLRAIGQEFAFNSFVEAATSTDWHTLAAENSPASRCLGLFRALYYKNRTELERCIAKFRHMRSMGTPPSLSDFHLLLQVASSACRSVAGKTTVQGGTPESRTFSSSGGRQTTINDYFPVSKSQLTSFNSIFDKTEPSSTSTSLTEPDSALEDFQDAGAALIDSGSFDADDHGCGPLKPKMFPKAYPTTGKGTAHAENYRLRDLPNRGLFVDPFPQSLEPASAKAKYELVRLCSAFNVPITAIKSGNLDKFEDYDYLYGNVAGLAKSDVAAPEKTSRRAWADAGNSPNVTRSASLEFAGKGSPDLFKLRLNKPMSEEKSFRLGRAFGAHRFLKLEVPSTAQAASFSCDEANFTRRFLEWLKVPDKLFMGYKWNALFARPKETRKFNSKNRKGRLSKDEDSRRHEIYLFATEGYGLEAKTIRQVIEWFIPFDANRQMSVCKAFARLELGFSRTFPTLIFKPGQVTEVEDILPDDTPENTTFNDPQLNWFDYYKGRDGTVMNDGCSRISTAAAILIWDLLPKRENSPVPSCFQGRIGPWKGVWMVASPVNPNASNDDVWIEVTASQCKFERHEEDHSEDLYDPNRLTFEVIDWSRAVHQSKMYCEYLPILQDRGMGRDALGTFVDQVLQREYTTVEEALHSDISLAKWIQDNHGSHITSWDGAFPLSRTSRARLMLESGFSFRKSKYLNNIARYLVREHFSDLTTSLNLHLPRSTHVIGVADPQGVLNPGEIHLQFSEQLANDHSGASERILHDVDVLVARHPTLRRSDMQKVRAVFKLELRHLVDVVVFPRKGCIPLASTLQGGDYDGDKFWLCWEEAVTKRFQNAPAPRNSHPPETFGITVDRKKFGAFQKSSHELDSAEFLSHSFQFVWQPRLLGLVTNAHTSLVYFQNTVSSPSIEYIADLHDYLVDSFKNGYGFNLNAWSKVQKSQGLTRIPNVDKLPFKKVASLKLFDKSDQNISYNSDNIVDHLIFNVAWKHARTFVQEFESKLGDVKISWDRNLCRLYRDQKLGQHPDVKFTLEVLRDQLMKIFEESWLKSHNLDNKSTVDKQEVFKSALRICRKRYQALQPSSMENEEIKTWQRRSAPRAPSHWELLKASCLFAIFYENHEFVFGLAGWDLCYLSAFAASKTGEAGNFTQNPRLVTPKIHALLKLKKIPKMDTALGDPYPAAAGEADEGSEDEDSSEDDEDFEDLIEPLLDQPSDRLDGDAFGGNELHRRVRRHND